MAASLSVNATGELFSLPPHLSHWGPSVLQVRMDGCTWAGSRRTGWAGVRKGAPPPLFIQVCRNGLLAPSCPRSTSLGYEGGQAQVLSPGQIRQPRDGLGVERGEEASVCRVLWEWTPCCQGVWGQASTVGVVGRGLGGGLHGVSHPGGLAAPSRLTGSTLLLRETSLLPHAPGLPALLSMLFAPVMELRYAQLSGGGGQWGGDCSTLAADGPRPVLGQGLCEC